MLKQMRMNIAMDEWISEKKTVVTLIRSTSFDNSPLFCPVEMYLAAAATTTTTTATGAV